MERDTHTQKKENRENRVGDREREIQTYTERIR